MTETDKSNATVWSNIVDWVHSKGGHIHKALTLEGTGTCRGIFACEQIAEGESLIRLPPSCVVSGENIDKTAQGGNQRPTSSWMKCVAAYYQSRPGNTTKSADFESYFKSLPDNYETLFQWTDDEVKSNLSGTTLGVLVASDRKANSMRERYRVAVRPRLQEWNLIEVESEDVSESEYEVFLEACMCISTRGFHLTSTSLSGSGQRSGAEESSEPDYQGPFLLPIIDLLNHNPPQKCTTLQRDDSSGFFCMKAERAIAKGEEVYHSYGDALTAAQMLQTFGFVPDSTASNSTLTPVGLHKTKHLLAACAAVKESDFPRDVKKYIESHAMEEDETWDVSSIQSRQMEHDAPDDWLISFDSPLSDELVTFLVLQFLPDEAYTELCPNDQISTWLDQSILEDFYLGKLVCEALQIAIQLKFSEYDLSLDFEGGISGRMEIERARMRTLCAVSSTTKTERTKYGIRIRMEELRCLGALYEKVKNTDMLLTDDAVPTGSLSKRARTE